MFDNITKIEGLDVIVKFLRKFFAPVSAWFEDLPIVDLWDSLLPADIMEVVTMIVLLMIMVAIIGIVRKFLVVFG